MDKKSEPDKTKYQHCHIFEIHNRTICLLCTIDISHDNTFSLISKKETITSHLLSESHELTVKTLFKDSFSDTLIESQDEKYTDFVQSLVLDTSLYLGKETSYIFINYGYNVTCRMCCHQMVEAYADGQSMETILFDHLKSKQHLQNLKKMLCWIYFFSEITGFILISQSRVYCSSCNETIGSNDHTSKTNLSLKALFDHLTNEHDLLLPRSKDNDQVCKGFEEKLDHYPENFDSPAVGKDNYTNIEPIYQALTYSENSKENVDGIGFDDHDDLGQYEDKLKLSVMLDPYNVGCLENNYDNPKRSITVDSFDNYSLEYCKDAQDNAYHKIDVKGSDSLENVDGSSLASGNAGEIYDVQDSFEELSLSEYDLVENTVSENSLLDFDGQSSDSQDYDDAYQALTCPDCGDFIEIINENAEFSLKLHSQKHKDLKSISTEDELVFNDNVDYICPVCHDSIPVFNKSIELSVRRHFEERKIDHEGFGYAESNRVKLDLLAHTFSTLPDPLKKYENFLTVEENIIFCKLCNSKVHLGNGVDGIAKVLHEHLDNSYHELQYKSLCQDLAQVVMDFNKQCQSYQPNQQTDQFEKLVQKHPLLRENKQFIDKKNIHYFCNLCQKHINHSPNESTLTLNFMSHLRSPGHTKAFKGVLPKKSEKLVLNEDKEPQTGLEHKMTTTLQWISQKSAEVHLNQYFVKINVENCSFHCTICKKSIEFSRSGSKLKSHCKSSEHNDILTSFVSKFLLKLCMSSEQSINDGYLKTVLDNLAGLEFLRPHTLFIIMEKELCKCVVCDVIVPTTKKKIQEHLFGNNHRKNVFKALTKINLKKRRRRKRPKACKDPKEVVKKSLASLLEHSPLVAKNSQFVNVKDEYFYCQICCMALKSSSDGKYLKVHLKSSNHNDAVKLKKKSR